MATHRDVSKIASYSCGKCNFEQVKIGGTSQWVKLISRLHAKKCPKTGRSVDDTNTNQLIYMTSCAGKLPSSKGLKIKTGDGKGNVKKTLDLPGTYHAKLGVETEKLSEKMKDILKSEFMTEMSWKQVRQVLEQVDKTEVAGIDPAGIDTYKK